jgi:hypothetical protein
MWALGIRPSVHRPQLHTGSLVLLGFLGLAQGPQPGNRAQHSAAVWSLPCASGLESMEGFFGGHGVWQAPEGGHDLPPEEALPEACNGAHGCISSRQEEGGEPDCPPACQHQHRHQACGSRPTLVALASSSSMCVLSHSYRQLFSSRPG